MKKHKKFVNLVPLKDKRFKITYVFCLLFIFSLFSRLVFLQVFSASDLQKKARLVHFYKINLYNKSY